MAGQADHASAVDRAIEVTGEPGDDRIRSAAPPDELGVDSLAEVRSTSIPICSPRSSAGAVALGAPIPLAINVPTLGARMSRTVAAISSMLGARNRMAASTP
jgi:hypothetical protein